MFLEIPKSILSLIDRHDNTCLQILKEEITPTLNKLKQERASYLEYQNVIRDLEHLNKLYIAYQFVCAQVCAANLVLLTANQA